MTKTQKPEISKNAKPKTRKPKTDREQANATRAFIKAWATRVSDGDYEDLAYFLKGRDYFDVQIARAVTAQREKHGTTWAMIGQAAGISAQGAYQRWGRDYDAILDRNARATAGRRGKQATTDGATNA